MSREEADALLSHVQPAHYPAVYTAVWTGGRQSEILGLLWANVDLRAGRLTFEAQLTRGSAKHPAERVSIKNERRRTIDIDPELVAFLRRHREAQFARGLARDTDYVFCTQTGEPLHYRNIGRAFALAVERAGIKRRVRFHSLRHRYASVLISGGCDGPYVAQQLGDTVATVYAVYAHLFNARSQTEKGLAAIRAARGDTT